MEYVTSFERYAEKRGKKKGKKEGEKEAALEIAKRMIEINLPLDTITKSTMLPKKTILELMKQYSPQTA